MMKRMLVLSLLAMVVVAFSAGFVVAKESNEKPLTLVQLTKKVDDLEKKEVTITGTIVGICKSGCKMWIADGEYKKGDPYALVRAKDDAFKFDKDATGKTVILHGYAVAKYMDYCAESGEKTEGEAMESCETPVTLAKDQKAEMKKDGEKKKEVTLKDITFFATKVEYK